jgi:16S rRNA (cytosine1402-N4)-methyltransferase
MSAYHKTVLLNETIDLLNVRKEGLYIDATLGGGGHAVRIIESGGRVLGIDADEEALDFVKENFKFQISNFKLKLARGNFGEIEKIAAESGFEKVKGIVFDLGVSSHQIDTPDRGFSFQSTGPLDMRMDSGLSVKARDLVNSLTRKELIELFIKLGEEYRAQGIADEIVKARAVEPVITTVDLVDIVKKAVPFSNSKINPATKVFQALRIAVNDEINNLRKSLPKAWELLDSRGRLAVISFHSLEDRVIKNKFKEWEKEGMGKVITKKPVIPTTEELDANKRSRSAKLRVIEKF